MSAQLLEQNPHLNMFAGQRHVGLLGIGDRAEEERKAANLAEARSRYLFPPKGCDDAILKLQGLETEIKTQQEVLATQGDSRVARRWIEAFTIVKSDFDKWMSAAKCKDQLIQVQDQQFWNQVDQALASEKAGSENKGTIDNWIIYGVLGAIAVGALIIILRK